MKIEELESLIKRFGKDARVGDVLSVLRREEQKLKGGD